MKKIIYIQKLGEIDDWILNRLNKNLSWVLKRFSLKVSLLPSLIELEKESFNQLRNMYNVEMLLQKLFEEIRAKNYYRVLAVMDEDIYYGFLSHCFGIARKPGVINSSTTSVAIISIRRFKEKFYQRSQNKSLLEMRILKESLHELGHTFGLIHCKNRCVMNFSERLMHIDSKPPYFCSTCVESLDKNIKNL